MIQNALSAYLAHSCSWHSAERPQQVGLYTRWRLKYKHAGCPQEIHWDLKQQTFHLHDITLKNNCKYRISLQLQQVSDFGDIFTDAN